MKNTYKLAPISLAILVSLTGCIEVDDDGSHRVAASLNQQNAILEQQNQLLAEQLEQSATVTVSGLVYDVDGSAPVAGSIASVRVLQGETVLVDAAPTQNGLFSIEGLPVSSDLTFYVMFSGGEYVNRAFFITTPPAADDEIFNDIGNLPVSKPVEISFTVQDEAGEVISDLVFFGTSHFGNSTFSTAVNYQHQASFDSDAGVYRITLPKRLDVTLRANLDMDGDGNVDFDLVTGPNAIVSGNLFILPSANQIEETVYSLSLSEEGVEATKSVLLALLDDDGVPIEGAVFTDRQGVPFATSYDEQNQRYIIEVSLNDNGYASINMPSFTAGDVTYSSGEISLWTVSDNTSIQVSTSGFNSNSYYTIDNTDTLPLAVVADAIEDTFDVELITEFLSSDDYAYTVYYSEPVVLEEAQASLTYNAVEVIAGNTSSEDSVPVGFTAINHTENTVGVNVVSGLNDTRYTLSANESLLPGVEYTYNVATISSPDGELSVDVSGDSKTFTTPLSADEIFDINDIYIDNRNFYSNGAILESENTAGVASTATDRQRSVYFHFPTTVELLNYLVINVVGYTENGVDYPYTRSIEVVFDGNVWSRKVLGVAAADNESIDNNASVNYITGSTAQNGTYVYAESTGVWLGDNTPSNVNSLTFNYEYQTQAGETVSGLLTLPVR